MPLSVVTTATTVLLLVLFWICRTAEDVSGRDRDLTEWTFGGGFGALSRRDLPALERELRERELLVRLCRVVLTDLGSGGGGGLAREGEFANGEEVRVEAARAREPRRTGGTFATVCGCV